MLLYTTFTIEAAHRLDIPGGTPEMHGHSYWIQLYVTSSADVPYPLELFEKYAGTIKTALDHKLLNDIIPLPTQEALVEHIRAIWPSGAEPLQKIIVRRDSLNTGVEWVNA